MLIARNTAFPYQGRRVNVKTIGRELNVRYVLEGSVQRSGNRMRVNVQLIASETGSHLWAERFDKPLADLFDMQDEIVARLASALNAQFVAVEARRGEKAPTPDSMDFYFQGLAWFNKGITPDNIAQARSFFDLALSADPDYVDALVGSAGADVVEGALLFTIDRIAAFAAAEAKLTKALSSVPDHARGHMWLGLVDILTKRAAEGIAECEHALALDRNLASARAMIGYGKIFIGRAEETETHIAEALRLSPRDTLAYIWRSIHAGDGEATISAVGSKRSSGFDGRSRLTEIIRQYISIWPSPLALLGRREEAFRRRGPASRSTRPLLPSPAPAPPGRQGAKTRRIWPSLSSFSTAYARPGSPGTMTAARRLAAILAADVVGYSRLTGQDEAVTAKAVREGHEASTPIVAGHGGRIVKTTGDGVLMELPSVVAAVECAIAIQKLMTEHNAGTPEGKGIGFAPVDGRTAS